MEFPFDPLKRASQVESLVMDGNRRRYYRFRFAKFYGGIVTCDSSGCNLLCAYCWGISKNANIESCNDTFYSPSEVASKVKALQLKHGVDQFRISGCESILGEASAKHLGEVIKLCKSKVVIETNGVMIGRNPALLDFIPKKNTRIRVTIKADNDQDFEKITGAKASTYMYQIAAIKALIESNRPFILAMMKQFVDIDKLSIELVKAGIDFDPKHMPRVDIEGLLYYPQNIKNMKERGVTPLYGGKA